MKQVLALMLAMTLICTLAACQPAQTEVSDQPESGVTTVKPDQDDDTAATTATKVGNGTTTDADETEETDAAGKTRKTRKTTTARTTKTTAEYTAESTTKRPAVTYPSVPTVDKVYATGRALKVACVGDSITAQGFWKNNLGGQLSTANFSVKGFGKSGATALFDGVDYLNESTNTGKAYVDQPEYDDSLEYGADIVVIMLGTNDSKIVNWPYYGDDFIDDYIRIVRSYQELPGEPMVFIALPPTVYSTGKFQDISNTRIEQEIIPQLKQVATATGAIIIDTHTPTGGDATLMSDGVHPSAAGKQVICETIAAAIKADTGRA